MIASLDEKVVSALQVIGRAWMPGNLWRVAQEHNGDGHRLTLEPPSPNAYYIATVDAVVLPAVFIIAQQNSLHQYGLQQGEGQTIQVDVVIVIEDTAGDQQLKRKAMRYGRAAWLTYHDYGATVGRGDYPFVVHVDRLVYGPPVTARSNRGFEMEVQMALSVRSFEAWR